MSTEPKTIKEQPHIKHKKYETKYLPNKLYWGLGIENEVYLEFQELHQIKKANFIKSCKRERYSVDYFSNYKKSNSDNALQCYVALKDDYIPVPILLNAHSFTRTDKFNNSMNLYTKLCETNPKFIGETLIETLCKSETDYFRNTMDKEWLFDGDTIEFNTLNFYDATLNNVLDELSYNKKKFITEINQSFESLGIFKYGKLDIMSQNHPFATFMTNFSKITIFNNGTLHYNLTLPTQLNNKCKIANYESFLQDHKKAIRIIQFMEPFLISVYGTPDIFSNIPGFLDLHLFSKSSQRCAVSRYIGIGTYDTDIMERGKIMTIPVDDLSYRWFNTFYQNIAYTKLDEIGLDINFNKHYNHGIELRFLEHIIDENKIKESFEFIILLMDCILDNANDIANPIYNKTWNGFVTNIMIHGNTYELNNEEQELYEHIFNIKIKKSKTLDVYQEIYNTLLTRYNHIIKDANDLFLCIPKGNFSKLTISPQLRKMDDISNDITIDISNDISNDIIYEDMTNTDLSNNLDNISNNINNENIESIKYVFNNLPNDSNDIKKIGCRWCCFL
jgi:hypothetical protein